MKITITAIPGTQQEALVLGLFEEDKELYREHNKPLSEELKEAFTKKTFKHEFGSVYATKITNSTYTGLLVIHLGKQKEFTTERLRRAMSISVRYAKAKRFESFTTNIAELAAKAGLRLEDIGQSASEGLILSDYRFDKYKSDKDNGNLASVSISWANSGTKNKLAEGISKGRIIAEATNYAKELVNEPSQVATPTYLAKQAKALASKSTNVQVMDRKELERLGMNAFLYVSKGGEDPKFIILEYKAKPGEPWTAIIGKGITFDSGGYNLKPSGSIEDMKCDMSGAAAVLATIKAAQQLGLKRNILGIIPSCENMVDGISFKPGDIIKSYSGKTIEIMNTDAEGRLILADAIAYTEDKYKPAAIIDLATLTGACVVALGYYMTGMVSNDAKLASELANAGEKSYDRVWQFPFTEEYMDNMDGDVSDLKNMSNKPNEKAAGAILGGVFLSKFLKKAKWAHLDIAGTAYLKEGYYYSQKYATGAGTRLLLYYFMDR